ncbi:MAG: tetratricopeptide repeat protein [Bacteroidales bacterium]
MKNTHLIILLLASGIALQACKQNKEKSPEENQEAIEDLEESLYQSTAAMDKDTVNLLVKKYDAYAKRYPEDSLAQQYLFRAARLKMAVEDFEGGLKYLEKIEAKYPDSDLLPAVLLLKGNIYGDYLNDFDKAEKAYQRIVDEYPASEFARDAEISIRNLGKSLDELIREFEEKNEKDSLHVS